MTGSFATRLFRIVFALAGCYNIAFGAWVSIWPLQFFEICRIEPPRYPSIWACVGMVVGVYGFLYWYAAWRLDSGRPIIAVGLLGKVLGPIGMLFAINDEWPRRIAMVNVYNDLIWWLPFTLFLVRGTPFAKRLEKLAPGASVALHVLGMVAIVLVLKPGTIVESDPVMRARYISEHSTSWSLGWGIWMLAALSLVGFYAWWGARLRSWPVATAGVMLAAAGSVFDLSGESLSVLVLVEQSVPELGDVTLWDQATFTWSERLATLLTAGAANALYTLGGFVLMLQTENLPGPVRAAMWATWLAGAGMTVAAVFDHVTGMMASTSILFPLLIVWTGWFGFCWDKRAIAGSCDAD